MTETTVVLASTQAAVLVSVIKPILLLAVVIPYARIISSKIEPDLRYFHFPVAVWNGVFVGALVAAFLVTLLVPLFWASWPLGILILAGTLWSYVLWRNKRVPENAAFHLIGDRFEKAAQQRALERAAKSVSLKFIDSKGIERDVPLQEDPLYMVHQQVEVALTPSIEGSAAYLDIVPTKGGVAISRVIDTMRYQQESLSPEVSAQVVDYLKDLAGLDLNDRRRVQEGAFKILSPMGSMPIELTVSGSSAGVRARVEFDRSSRLHRKYNQLGLTDPQRALIDELDAAEGRHGLVLLAAPSGGGLTTTAYSLLGRHDAYTSNIKTVEHRVDVLLDGVDHQAFDAGDASSDFATLLQTTLRRDPDIVYVSDIDDAGTADIAARPGLDGPLLYLGIPADSVAGALQKWIRGVGDMKKAAAPLRMIIVGRVLRKLCPNCRQPFQPSPEQLKKFGLPESKAATLYRAGGQVQVSDKKIEPSPVCNGIGFTGTIGAYEVMPIDATARKAIVENDFPAAVAHARREHRMMRLQEVAMLKVLAGETSIEEVARVLAPRKKSGGSSSSGGDKSRQPATSGA